MSPRGRPQGRTASRARSERGAALLLALLLVALVATLASAMVWQHWRAVQVEAAERARAQAAWILDGATDWVRLILREDRRSGSTDHLGEPWATPLAEARLSTFLAVDRDRSDESDVEAFLSGEISDAQARYNLRNASIVSHDANPLDAVQTEIDENICVICQESLTDDQNVVSLRCCHRFHGQYLCDHLVHDGRCPVCRDSPLPMVYP